MHIGKQNFCFTFCGFAKGCFHHVWLIDRVRMMKRPPLQKYQKGDKPTCASYADLQSCSSPACAADLTALHTADSLRWNVHWEADGTNTSYLSTDPDHCQLAASNVLGVIWGEDPDGCWDPARFVPLR